MLLSDISSVFDENIFYHKIDNDSGLAAGRNFLIQQVLTDFVLVLDDDFVFRVYLNMRKKAYQHKLNIIIGEHQSGCSFACAQVH